MAGLTVDPSWASAPVSRVVVTLGTEAVDQSIVKGKVLLLPLFQRGYLGLATTTGLRKYVDDVVVRDELLSLFAAEQKLAEREPNRSQIERAYSNATLRQVRDQVGRATSIPIEDVTAYYEAHRSLYEAPERILVWRVLLASREEARALLEVFKKSVTVESFRSSAREKSLDKASYLRGGDLGFLEPDGTSHYAGLKVDPALSRAASVVKDGELVPTPIPEGENFAVIWRRGTVPAQKRKVDEVASQIRDVLWKERTEVVAKTLLSELRKEHVRFVRDDVLTRLELPPIEGPPPPPSASAR